jgi:hypothetical protein
LLQEEKPYHEPTVCKNCYQKYLFSINYVYKEVTKVGREVKSDFVAKAVGAKKTADL